MLGPNHGVISHVVSDWYLYEHDGEHRGPLTMEALVKAIRAGEIAGDHWVAPEQWFAPPGASGWRRADDVPEIARLVALRSRGTSELQLVDGAFTSNRRGTPEFGATVMMRVKDGS